MTQDEFYERMPLPLWSKEEYEEAKDLFYAIPFIDMDDFCALYAFEYLTSFPVLDDLRAHLKDYNELVASSPHPDCAKFFKDSPPVIKKKLLKLKEIILETAKNFSKPNEENNTSHE